MRILFRYLNTKNCLKTDFQVWEWVREWVRERREFPRKYIWLFVALVYRIFGFFGGAAAAGKDGGARRGSMYVVIPVTTEKK